ncbi:MAG: sulfide/dihydroorotate dehydrogenase-like FAD/NAD-binding protein [Syntrophomonadaceae bacterium]|nr:sulfide/dihydroorotate dehydrogenase-like FAD/NAD-binding protein [Syntrophomonadaceae bacterium]
MFKILRKEVLANKINLFDIKAPYIAKKAKPGQFVIVRTDDYGERIPLTIADFDREAGFITIILQEIGRSTYDMGKLEVGDFFLDVVGPLGKPSVIQKYGRAICIGGGVGVAPIYPITRALQAAGNHVISILGANSSATFFGEKMLKAVSDELYITTNDGTYGEKGLVTDVLKRIISNDDIDIVFAIGPLGMMEAVSKVTSLKRIKTVVSLNPIMLDGTGMCGACRVEVGNEKKFACVDGPEFDGHLVDWENAKQRARMFEKQEKVALTQSCNCHSKGEGCNV